MNPFSFAIITFGCKVNQYESQAIREYWTSLGGQESNDARAADVVLLASCAVTAEAVADARQMVRRLGREAPGARLIVTGCAATAELGDFALPGVAAILPQVAKAQLLLGHPLDAACSLDGTDAFSLPPFKDISPAAASERGYPPFRVQGFNRARPVLKVQDGCSHRCTYCIIPFTRGPACSRDPDDALAETRRLLNAGFREIIISGVNLRQYHRHGLNFWGLLRQLDAALAGEWQGRARLRLSSLEPAQLDAEGLETLEACRLLCPHLHLSLQSGSSFVLRRMGREHYAPEQVADAVKKIRSFWPEFGLGADILMGFPGESSAEADETLRMVDMLPLTYAHVFPWSSRPGTPAAAMPDILPRQTRQEHAARVRQRVAAKHEAFLRHQAALTAFYVALEGDGSHTGHNEYYASCKVSGRMPVRHSGLELAPCRPLGVEGGKVLCEWLGAVEPAVLASS